MTTGERASTSTSPDNPDFHLCARHTHVHARARSRVRGSIVVMTSYDWNAQTYAENVGFVPELGRTVLDLLDPQGHELVLDLGCGDGVLTAELASRAGRVHGIDASPDMVAAAQDRGLDAQVVHGAKIAEAITEGRLVAGSFDAVFTNAALHWIPAAQDVIAGVHQLLKPGGRFVGEFGGHGNVASLSIALHAARRLHGVEPAAHPWFFPTAAEYEELLRAGGFDVRLIEIHHRPTPLPTGAAGWIETFGDPFLGDLDADTAQAVAATAVELVEVSMRDSHGNWTADYVRLRFAAVRI